MISSFPAPWRLALVLGSSLALSGCGGNWAFRQGKSEAKQGNWDRAVGRFTKALDANPDNIEYRVALDRARQEASRVHYAEGLKHLQAHDFEQAQSELDIAVKFDSANRLARERLADVMRQIAKREDEQRQRSQLDLAKERARAVRLPVPVLSPRSTAPITLRFTDTSLIKIFQSLGKLSGVNVVMDPDVRDKKVDFDVTGITFEEALDQLTLLHKLFYKVVDQNTLVIVNESPQKRRTYDDLLVQTFYLSNAETKEITAVVKGLIASGTSFKVVENATLGAISVTGTADQLALAGRIIVANDKPRGEVVVEIKIMEISRQGARRYGIALANYGDETPNYKAGVAFAPFSETVGANVNVRAHLLSSINLSDFVVTLPSQVITNLLETKSAAKLLASPRLRASEGKKTSLKIGTEIAIPSTTFTNTQTAPTNGAFGSTTSFQTRPVGVNMDVTPKISAGGEITLEIQAEFSAEGQKRPIGGLDIPDILTRNLNGILRLRDGETSMIGGLRQHNEKNSDKSMTGLSSVPLLNRIFGSKLKESDDSEVVIAITPHIVRAPIVSDEDLMPMAIGTGDVPRVPGVRQPLLGLAEPAAAPSPTPTPTPAATPPPAGARRDATPPSSAVVPEASVPRVRQLSEAEKAVEDAMVAPQEPTVPSPGVVAPGTSAPAASPGAAAPLRAQFAPTAANVKTGEIGALSLVLIGARDLLSLELVLTYDPAVIEALDIAPGALLSLDGANVGAEKDIGVGRARVRFTRTSPALGTGAVAVFTFKGKQPGNGALGVATLSVSGANGSQAAEVGAPARVTVTP